MRNSPNIRLMWSFFVILIITVVAGLNIVFKTGCDRDSSLVAHDGQYKIIFNAKATGFRDNIKIGNFFKLMENQTVMKDPLVSQVVREMKRIKQDPERRRRFIN